MPDQTPDPTNMMPARLVAGLRTVTALLTCLFAAGCGDTLSEIPFERAVGQAHVRSVDAYGSAYGGAELSIEPIRATPLDLQAEENGDYKIGIGDLLNVNIFGEPGMDGLIVRVDRNGQIQLPYLSSVEVLGRSALQIQADLTDRFAAIFKNPWVVVGIHDYRSRPVNLIGQFNTPGVFFLDGPTDLMRAIGFAGGVGEAAFLRGARLWRGDAVLPVDIHALLVEGRTDYNLQLRAGDTIYVPSVNDLQAYILGAVVRPGAVPFSKQPMTLLKALSEAGGVAPGRAYLGQVRIIRTISALEGQLILADVGRILKGHAPDITLRPDDIVYVPQTILADWNDALRAITPSLQMAGGVLQPFVQLKFLTGDS